jgi:hypothetical protein
MNYDSSAIKRMRIRISIFAYAYEMLAANIISDSDYDQLSILVHNTRNISTDNLIYDNFFREEFDKDTGMWIRKHPDCFNGKLDSYTRYIIKLTSISSLYKDFYTLPILSPT